MDQSTLIQSLKRCPSFERCNFNVCPLDLELELRTGGNFDKCKWMREKRQVTIRDKQFTSGGVVMPDALLICVPSKAAERLNEASRARWNELNNR